MSTTQSTALVVDSGACLAPSLAEAPWVSVVPMSIEIDDQVLRDGIDITNQELYARLSRPGPLPTSSSPSPGEYLKAFRAVTQANILCLTIPARFSMMGRSARLAAEMLKDEQPEKQVEVVDTGTAAGGFTLVAEGAAAACAAGLSLEAVSRHAQALAGSVHVIAALDTMRFLVRSGRVPAIAGRGSDLLHVRPVFAFTDGDVRRVALVRGTSRALHTVASTLFAEMGRGAKVKLAAFCGDSSASMPALIQALQELFGPQEVQRLNLTPVIALHTGPGLVGAAAITDLPLPS